MEPLPPLCVPVPGPAGWEPASLPHSATDSAAPPPGVSIPGSTRRPSRPIRRRAGAAPSAERRRIPRGSGGPGRGGGAIRARTPAEEALAEALAVAEKRLAEVAAEAADARERLSAERRVREELVRNVSHELRTPLAVIAGFNKLLLSERVGALNPSSATSSPSASAPARASTTSSAS